ncbi:unnamed protein product [Brassicogethes aeneus]|uniref:HMG box domain-containing protein n=1 Tax=Brassicogethes aeneus TaxID=1431903 RepID=A0A9P0FPF0_BRAAE|nr:unnamed protein product [Brassicogethes aeneus]
MNSKKTRKEKVKVDKQSGTELNESEKTNISENNKKKKKKLANNNVENIENSTKSGRKRKTKQILEENTRELVNKKSKKNKLSVSEDNDDEVPTNGISCNEDEQYIKKSLSDDEDTDHEEDKVNAKENNVETEKKKEEIMWSNEDLMELVANMEKLIPKNDIMAFTTRTEKLEWDKVIFKEYTVEDCKKTWNLLSKKIRRYRLLHEVLDDARQLIVNPPSQKNKKNKQIHPDMPKRPLSSYLLFYLKKKDKITAEFPGMELTEISKKIGNIYKNLTPEKKAIYEEMAAKAKEEYEEKMKEFYENHPEFQKVAKVPAPKPIKERVPKKPSTPFGFYYQSELTKENIPDAEKQQFKERCKSRWKEMSDKKKLIWITWAEEQNALYESNLQTYKANHPDYVVNHTTKLILTKEEKSVKERVAGKPIKPPVSAYALFSRNVLQTPQVKDIPNKERWNFVAAQWKTCSEEEKKHYKDLQTNLMEQYKLDFAQYLETLPEDKRNLELQTNAPKKRKSEEHVGPSNKKRKKTEEKATAAAAAAAAGVKTEPKPKFQEPEQPPRSAFKYFAQVYGGKEPAAQAWKKLPADEKEKFEEELIIKKREYIAAFEKFLKSLSKEELEAFSNSRNQVKQQTAADSDDEEEEEEEEDEEEEEEEQEEESDDGDSSGSNSDSSDDE